MEFISANSLVPLFSLDENQMSIHMSYAAVETNIGEAYEAAANSLTAEEKLLVAQEKRGKVIPESDEKKNDLLEQAHAAGHYGEKFMYKYVKEKGYWWPKMRVDIMIVGIVKDTLYGIQVFTQPNPFQHLYPVITSKWI